MRIMAIDYGEKRIGVALSDPLGIIAQPLETIEIEDDKELIPVLKKLIIQNEVGLLLVGNPIDHKGNPTRMSRKISDIMTALRNECAVEIELWDERFTSRLAKSTIRDHGIRSRKNKKKIDAIAASIMLSEYLTKHRS